MTIVYTQGDDSDAIGNVIEITLDTELDLTGYTARFQLGNFKQDFNDITSKNLEVVIPHSVFVRTGTYNGALKIWDANGKCVTVARDLEFQVLTKVVSNVGHD